MKDEYLIWKRLERTCKETIFSAQTNIIINQELLLTAKRKIKELERAGKVPKKIEKPNTCVG